MLRRDAVRMIDREGKYKEHNRDVLAKLKAAYRDSDHPDLHYSVYLPNNLLFTLSKVNCEIYIESEQVVHNMQLDTAAFDSWALILNAWLNLEVSLAWDPPPISDPPETAEVDYLLSPVTSSVDRPERPHFSIVLSMYSDSRRLSFNILE